MSTIYNSYEYYEGNQSLLSMLNKKKTGNKLINQIIADNETAYKKKMESMGIYTDSSKDKYSNVAKASDSLLDAIEDVTKEELYKVQEGKEYDKSPLLKSITNFVTAYNNEITSLNNCGGALNQEFAKEFKTSFTANKDALEEIGITLDDDGKLTINQEKLSGAPGNKLKTVFGDNSGYIKSVTASVDPINDILGKVRALRSSNYNSKGIMF